ncbi:MAG: hypothetical protein BWY28_02370 [bacterium ADurb.Bin236]|mgnify:FL=1|nr:MAG: hypothetical protein BWY28_02370 [bacterium ADurb.Bin236]HOY62496.1 hypothetical protein [bacterium]
MKKKKAGKDKQQEKAKAGPGGKNEREKTVAGSSAESGKPTRISTDVICAVAAAAVIIAHFIIVATCFRPATSNMDSHGYYKQARLIAEKGRTYEIKESRAQYTGYTWRNSSEERYDNLWPVGFPAILATVRAAFGPEGAYWADPVMAALALAAFYLLCRALIGPGWALAALAVFVLNPLFNQHIQYRYSHIAALLMLMASMAFIEAGWNKKRAFLWLFAAGFFAGYLPSIRLLECFLGPPLFLYVAARALKEKPFWKKPAAFAAGAAVPIAAFCVWNHLTYGAFWRTGYSVFEYGEMGIFSIEYLALYSLSYIQKLLGEGGGFALSLGALGIVWLCSRRETWLTGALLAALAIPFTLVQMSFTIHPNPGATRYFLSMMPLFTLAAVWMLKDLSGGKAAMGALLAATLIALSALWGVPQAKYSLNTLKTRQNALSGIADMLEQNVPRGSVVVADEVVAQHLDVLGYWKVAEATLLVEDRERRYGNMPQNYKIAAFASDLREWAGDGGRIFWVGKDAVERRIGPFLGGGSRLEPVADITFEKNPYLIDSDFALRTRNRTSPNLPPILKRGCFNFDLGAQGRLDMAFASLLDGSPVNLYEITGLR